MGLSVIKPGKIIPARPTSLGSCLGHFGIFIALWGVRRGLKMILSHRAPSSLHMSSYRAIWAHFRPSSKIFTNLILQKPHIRTSNLLAPVCSTLRKAEDLMPRDIRSSYPRHWMVFCQLVMPVQCCAEAPAAAVPHFI